MSGDTTDVRSYFFGWSDAKADRQYGEGRRLSPRLSVLQQIAALALDGQTPHDGYWYAPDENGDPHFRNDAVTPEQQAELDAIRQANGVRE